jgi:hypothetical protein
MLRIALSLVLALGMPAAGFAAETASEDVVPGVPFKEGDVIAFEQIDKLKDYLPPEFWENREYFFFEGMQLEVGPFFRKYATPPEFDKMTERYLGQPKLGKDGALESYKAGLPFPKIDCKGDPDAGAKLIWNFVKRWEGDGSQSNWSYTYWDRGEQLPLYYEGTAKFIFMTNKVEPQFEANGNSYFSNEKRKEIQGVEVEAPFDARGILVMTYRYVASEAPIDVSKNDDTWVYVPDLRRVRRISTAQRTDSVQGTDFSRDDLRSFDGVPPQYDWKCLGETNVIAPFNAKGLAYPYRTDYNFGPYGFSYANDRWEMRHAYMLRFDPKNEDHPYSRKDIYVDKETFEPLYSFAYDRKKELWKIIWHMHRYSEDWRGETPESKDPLAKTGIWYDGWEGVSRPSDARVISDIIVNVQTGTGNRIEFWNNHGMPLADKGKIRRYIDIGRLNKGR